MNHIQARMCRAALKMSVRDIAAEIGISHTAVTHYELGSDKVGLRVERRLEGYYRARGAHFGPASSVAWDQDIFDQDRWLARSLLQLLKEQGVEPSSRDLINAGKRAETNGS